MKWKYNEVLWLHTLSTIPQILFWKMDSSKTNPSEQNLLFQQALLINIGSLKCYSSGEKKSLNMELRCISLINIIMQNTEFMNVLTKPQFQADGSLFTTVWYRWDASAKYSPH